MPASLAAQLLRAITTGDVGKVQALVSRGVGVTFISAIYFDSDCKPAGGMTPLMLAARHGQVEVIRALIAAGAKIEAKGHSFSTSSGRALHQAARYGHVEALRALLEAGAKPNSRDSVGATPLFDAVRSGNIHAVSVLLDAGADPLAKTIQNLTAVRFAKRTDKEIILLLNEAAKNAPTPVPKKRRRKPRRQRRRDDTG